MDTYCKLKQCSIPGCFLPLSTTKKKKSHAHLIFTSKNLFPQSPPDRLVRGVLRVIEETIGVVHRHQEQSWGAGGQHRLGQESVGVQLHELWVGLVWSQVAVDVDQHLYVKQLTSSHINTYHLMLCPLKKYKGCYPTP